MFKVLMLIFSVSLIVTGCGEDPSEDIGYGIIENNLYKNDYFNMSIEVPDNWTVQSQARQKKIMASGIGLISGEDENLNVILDEVQKQTVNLFSFFKYEIGSPVEFNPSIIAVAERVSQAPGVKRGSDYNFHVKNLLQSGQMKYAFPDELYSKEVSGVLFDVMPAQINFNGITVYQEYYAARFSDYVLAIVLSYSSDAEFSEINKNLSVLNFSKK